MPSTSGTVSAAVHITSRSNNSQKPQATLRRTHTFPVGAEVDARAQKAAVMQRLFPNWSNDPTERAALVLQHSWRAYRSRGVKLHRFNLSERLKFEWEVCCGAFRLFAQIMTFVLLIVALQQYPTSTMRALYQSIESAFDFKGLQTLSDREALFNTGLQRISHRSKDYFAMSSKYFESAGGGVELLRNSETLTSPKIIGALNLPILLPQFSLSVWVRTDPQFVRGYLVRKRLSTAGNGANLACFGWHLDKLNGPSLHYGASDFYPTQVGQNGAEQEQVSLGTRFEIHSGQFHLLSLIISFDPSTSRQSVTFYRDLEVLGSTELPRPITDCYNNLDGVLVGDTGLTIAQLRFYPRQLSPYLINEIYVIGTVLEDVATGSQPATEASSPLESFSRTLETTLASLQQRIVEQQPRSEIDLVLQAVDSEIGQDNAESSPPAPTGMLRVENSTRVDAATGREYTLLLEGPYTMTRPPPGQERYLDPAAFPRWSGQGMSLSLWIRRSKECGGSASCGTYILSSHHDGAQSSARCYSAWVEKRGVYFDNLKDPVGFHYALDFMDERYHLTPNHWRHIVFVWDQDTDDWLFYQDGQLAYQVPWGSSVKDADCTQPATRVTIGARFPAWTYGLPDEYYDMRMWVGKALSASDIRLLAVAKTPALTALQFVREEGESEPEYQERTDGFQHVLRCTPDDAETMQDTAWFDMYGHTCQWYFFNVQKFANLCKLVDAQLNCPIACKTVQPCVEAVQAQAQTDKTYFVWDSIRRMEPKSVNGTLCLHNRLRQAQVREQCHAWKSSPGRWQDDARGWLADMDQRGDVVSVRVNMTDCEQVAASIDEHCSFDHDAVRDFTTDLRANGGDYTIGFWIKPLDQENSLHSDGSFYPSVSFLSTISPPTMNVAFGKFGTGVNGEVRVRTSCGPNKEIAENVELLPASADGWTFIAASRSNSTSKGLTATDLGGMREETGEWTQCLFDEEMLFSAIEVNYPVLLSPVMLVPRSMPLSKLQEIYYQQVNMVSLRNGPFVTNAQRNATTFPMVKKDLLPHSVLMATPLLFSTRVRATAQCPFDYSRQLLEDQHSKVLDSKCAYPFICSDQVRRNPEATIPCAGEAQRDGTFFGLEPRSVNGLVGYADLLYSITDSELVFRDGQLRHTKDFIDVLTQEVMTLLVFYTPDAGITSVLQISADVSSPQIYIKTALLHYTVFEGPRLVVYIAVLCLVCAVAFIMAIDVVGQYRAVAHRKSGGQPLENDKQLQLRLLTDAFNIIMIFLFVVLQLPTQIKTAGETKRILGALEGIEWESGSVTLEQKKDVFFENVLLLLDTIQINSNLDAFLNVILLVSILRIIQCTSMHPRLALLTGTLARAADDLWHTAILIVMIMVSFAGIATWRFGNQYTDFGSFEKSMQTEFRLMFGEFLLYWGESRELQAFVVLYYMVMFLLILNFLLAVIVEAYLKVRRYNEEIEYENEFFHDLSFSIVAYFHGKRRGWPSQVLLGHSCSKLSGKLSLGYKDLFHMGLFRCQKDIEDFLSFYSVLSCLEPPVVDSSGLTTDAQLEPESKKIVKEISEMLQLKKPKLKDVARDAELRRIGSEAHLGALGLGQSFSLHRLNLLRTGSKGGSHGQCGAWGGGGVFDYDANHHHPPLAQPRLSMTSPESLDYYHALRVASSPEPTPEACSPAAATTPVRTNLDARAGDAASTSGEDRVRQADVARDSSEAPSQIELNCELNQIVARVNQMGLPQALRLAFAHQIACGNPASDDKVRKVAAPRREYDVGHASEFQGQRFAPPAPLPSSLTDEQQSTSHKSPSPPYSATADVVFGDVQGHGSGQRFSLASDPEDSRIV